MKKIFILLAVLIGFTLSGSFIYAEESTVPTGKGAFVLPTPDPHDNGTLIVEIDGVEKTFKAYFPANILLGEWSLGFENRGEQFYINLPLDIQSGDKFYEADSLSHGDSMGYYPARFGFSYQIQKGGNIYYLGVNNVYESFGLIIDRWDGRGGFAEGRFVATLRFLFSDPIIMENGRFKIKIRR